MQGKKQAKKEKQPLFLTCEGKREAVGVMLPLTAAALCLPASRKAAYG